MITLYHGVCGIVWQIWGVFHVELAGVHVGRDVPAGEHCTRRKIREEDQEAALDGDVAETG